MSFMLGLAQSGFPADGNVLGMVESYAAAAQEAGVDLLVFPENLMAPRQLDAAGHMRLAEPLDGPFCTAVRACAKRHGLWMVFTMMEENPADARPFNTAVACDDTGAVRGTYRKCHLYDAHTVKESDRMSAGDALGTPIVAPFGTFGMAICYDLRFPEVARSLALGGCDLIVFPSAWHDGPHKARHWQTLLAARAIENECFVAGVCHAGSRYVGLSTIYGPLGQTLAQGSAATDREEAEALVVARIDPAQIAAAREAMPVFEHRRPEAYRAC